MTAARTGSVAAVKALLAHGANVNAKEGWKGQTALMWAAAENNAGGVQGADRGRRRRQGPVEGRRVHAAPVCGSRRAHRRGARAARRRRGRQRDAARRHQPAACWPSSTRTTSWPAFLLDRGADPNADAPGLDARCIRLSGAAGRTPASTFPAPCRPGVSTASSWCESCVKLGANVNARQTEGAEGRLPEHAEPHRRDAVPAGGQVGRPAADAAAARARRGSDARRPKTARPR